MAGLLDGFSGMSDGDQMGLALAQGLLSARGGPGFAAGLGNMQTVQDGLLKRQLTRAQLAEMNLKTQMDQQTLQRGQSFLDAYKAARAGDQQGATTGAPSSPAIPALPGGPLGSGTFGMSVGGQQASAPTPTAQSNNPFVIRGVDPRITDLAAFSMPPGDFIKTVMEKNGPQTDIEKLAVAAGYQRGTPEFNNLVQGAINKANYVAPVNARPGSILRDPNTNRPIAFNPHIPDGSTPVFDASGNVTGLRPLSGAYQAIADAKNATEFGAAEAVPTVAYDASGQPIFSTKANDVRRAGGGLPGAARAPMIALPPQPGVTGNFKGDPAQVSEAIASIKDPQERANALAAFESQMRANNGALPPVGGATPVQRPGAQQGAVLSQDELSKKGTELMASNGQVPTVINRLQNIKMLAPGAITGAESSRRDFFNGILSLAGIKGAEDAKTASDLVDKNASQIVSALRMGQGGAGTDALQTLLGAANPNRHMTKEAINEAADQLIASQKMVQDKARVLQPHYLGRDPVAYGQKEMTFDQNADPRIWQWRAISDPKARAAFAQSIIKADPTFPAKIQALESIGALK